MKKQIQLLILSFLLVVITNAQIKRTDKIPFNAAVKTGKLTNGLTYYIRANQKPEKKVELRLVVNAGSILEDNDQQGLAHFTEHMSFNGTKNFKKNELVSFLQSIGVDFGADLNAYTGFDETVYILPIPLSDPNNFKKGMQVLQDWASTVAFENKQIDDERGVVLEESRSGKGADDRMFRKAYPKQYEGSKYALRLPIGKDSILKAFKYDAIKRFYKDWYRPNLMAVLVVGDIDVAATEKMIQDMFGGLKNPTNPRPRTAFPVPARTKNDAMVLTDKEATNYTIQMTFSAVKTATTVTYNDYRNELLIKPLFTNMLNQRMNELAQSANPPFSFAGGGFNSYARGYESFNAYAVAGKKGIDTAYNGLLTEIERVKRFGFTQGELERAKKSQLASLERSYNNRDKTESSRIIEEYIRHFLQQEPSPGIEAEFNIAKELLPGIQMQEVNAIANQLKQNEKVFVNIQGPEKADIILPTQVNLLSAVENASKLPVKAYEEKAIASSLLKSKPIPGNLVKETKNEVLGITELQYSNGTKVILKPTTFKQDEIIMTGFKKGGISTYGLDDKYSAENASTIIQQMGIGDFSPVDLRKFLAGKIASASIGLSAINVSAGGRSSIKDVETMFQLLYLNFTNTRKDEALFTAWKEKQKIQMQFMTADPQFAFLDSVYKVLYDGNPLAPTQIPKPSNYDKINFERSLAIYKELISDANDFTFIMVGNIDVESIKPLLATYIGSLPSKGGIGKIGDNGVRVTKGVKDFTVYKGKEQKSFILNIYSGEVPYSEDLAFKAEILSEILNIKIIEDLREKIGGIYSGGINGTVQKYPYNSYIFGLQLPCGPENVDKLKKAAAEEIEKIKTNGPEQKDLDKVKKSLMEKYTVNMKENNFWTGVLQGIYFSEKDPQRTLNYEKVVNDITVNDLKKTASLLFDGKNIIGGILQPEKQ
ncbi:MAG: insulinase family protein [Bacteroidetes bacterium]|nr:insulinase family protein [Bacteroidota bacterium]